MIFLMQPSGLRKIPFDPDGPVKIFSSFNGKKMQVVIWHASDNCCYLQEALQIEILSLFTLVFLT